MGELVHLELALKRRDLNVNEAFEKYVAAKVRVDQTLSLEDGLKAAKAWRLFLELFVGPRQ